MDNKHEIRNSYYSNLKVSGWKLTSIEISQYYKTRPGREMITDDLIISLVKGLNGKKLIPDPKKRPGSYDYFTLEPIFDEKDNPYCLICCHEDNSPIWGVVNIYPIKIKKLWQNLK